MPRLWTNSGVWVSEFKTSHMEEFNPTYLLLKSYTEREQRAALTPKDQTRKRGQRSKKRKYSLLWRMEKEHAISLSFSIVLLFLGLLLAWVLLK